MREDRRWSQSFARTTFLPNNNLTTQSRVGIYEHMKLRFSIRVLVPSQQCLVSRFSSAKIAERVSRVIDGIENPSKIQYFDDELVRDDIFFPRNLRLSILASTPAFQLSILEADLRNCALEIFNYALSIPYSLKGNGYRLSY
jgi:hypothetical protein